MKLIQLGAIYDVPAEYKYVALNNFGILCGFMNVPSRNYALGQWEDSVTGSTGEIIMFDRWDQSCREVALLCDKRLVLGAAKKLKQGRKD